MSGKVLSNLIFFYFLKPILYLVELMLPLDIVLQLKTRPRFFQQNVLFTQNVNVGNCSFLCKLWRNPVWCHDLQNFQNKTIIKLWQIKQRKLFCKSNIFPIFDATQVFSLECFLKTRGWKSRFRRTFYLKYIRSENIQ